MSVRHAAMGENLIARAWFALAILAVVMGLLLFVPAGTVHYWQAWAYWSLFTGASALTTVERAARRCRGRRRARCDRVLFDLAGVSGEHFHVGNHRSCRGSEGHFNRAVCNRSPPDVRERVPVPFSGRRWRSAHTGGWSR